MLKQEKTSKRGFTIIEVVLVLAIAGLIFLMVFLALPALQRSQRDTERRNKLGEFKTQIVQYQSNNRGKVPSDINEWYSVLDSYMNLGKTAGGGTMGPDNKDLSQEAIDDLPFLDPTGEPYVLAYFCDMSNPAGTDGKSTNSNLSNVADLCTSSTGGQSNSGQSGQNGAKDKVSTTGLSWNDDRYQIFVFKNARCDGEDVVNAGDGGGRLVAFVTKLEGNGVYCGEN